ncbi:MAG TPA: ATPase, T2SS/T4P/T4SS family [Polyangiales bacterium]
MHPQDRLFCEIAVQLELLTRDQVAECLQTLERDPRGRNISNVATELSFMSRAEVDLVLAQQQRVLDRRREARAASKGQREAESRADARPRQPPAATEPRPARPRPIAPPARGAIAGTGQRPNEIAAQRAIEPAPAHRTPEVPAQRVPEPAAPRSFEPFERAFDPAQRSLDPPPSAAGALGDPQRVRRTDPTPTAPWVHASAEPGLAGAEAQLSADPLDDDVRAALEARETLDEHPAALSGKTAPPAVRDEASFEAIGAAFRSVAPPKPALDPSSPPRRKIPTQLEAQPSAPPKDGPPKAYGPSGTLVGPPRPSPAVSATTTTASASKPPPSAAMTGRTAFGVGPAVPATGHGTLLSGAALSSRRPPEAATRARRPVPSGRDWRNPSRPPPPTAALDADPGLLRVSHADTMALPGSAGANRFPQAPALDAPRYLERALEIALQAGASDLHVHAGAPLAIRVDGTLFSLSTSALTRDDTERAIAEVLDETQRTQLLLDGDLRFSHETALGRFRAHAFGQSRGTDIVFRLLPKQLAAAETLGLGPALRSVRDLAPGLFIFSGPAGSGKTTTLAALTAALANDRARHIVSIEDPIEIVHEAGLGLIEQRELGEHVDDHAGAIRLAQLQAADVIVVSDLGEDGALEAALRAASARCIVLAGLRASSAAHALTRLLRVEAARAGERLRHELAHAMRVVMHQRLLPRAKGEGRVVAFECLINTPQVAQLVREDKLPQLTAAMSAGRNLVMILLDDALDELVRAGTITSDAARRAAHRRDRFKGA